MRIEFALDLGSAGRGHASRPHRLGDCVRGDAGRAACALGVIRWNLNVWELASERAVATLQGHTRASCVHGRSSWAYLTFADPDPATSIEVLAACAEAGAGVIELGVSFGDPSADGPSIQRAMERALAAGGSLAGALDAVAALRARGIATPIVLFGYYNPIFVMGQEAFAARTVAAGVDAVLTVDLPIDELDELAVPLAAQGVSVIPLVAPTSTPDRIARLAQFAAPFVYYITLTGVTGARLAALVDPARLATIREAAKAPVAVGFGIRSPADAGRFAAIADGVVVGTVLVDQVAAGPAAGAPERVAALVRELASAMKR